MPVYTPNIVEPLYDASRAHFSLCNDMENGVMKNRNARVEYRSKWDNEWKTEPGYGEIFARTIDGNGHFVTPVKFINVGNGVAVNVVSADEQTCKIQVVWEHGRVTTADGVKRVSDVWEINKADISGNKIRFTLIPEDNSNNQFDIHVKAPFKEFAILDTDEKAISSDCWIPYSDIHNYQYHLIGQGLQYTYGEHRRQLKWIEEKLYITEDGNIIKTIPYEGSLLSLLGSREELRQLLDRTSQNMLNAEVNVKFVTQDGNRLTFAVKDFPYRVDQLEDGKIVIKSKDKKIIDYRGDLKLFKLDDPSVEPERLAYDEEVGYQLPETIRPWGKTLLVGRTRGRICPKLVDLTREMTGEARWANRERGIKKLKDCLEASTLGEELWQSTLGWFRCVQEEGIPASSLLGLYCVAQSPNALMCFAFQLFAQCDDEEDCETLVEQLKSFSADLAFSWYWLLPYLNSALKTISGYIGDVNDDRYINLAMRQGDNSFDAWMKKLCVASLMETYDCETDDIIASVADRMVYHPNELFDIDDKDYDYIDISQDHLGNDASKFFDHYAEDRKKGNEAWMWKRVNAVQAHLNGQVDLFAETEEIRRSVVFCQKSCNKQFVIWLNNKLKSSKNEVR